MFDQMWASVLWLCDYLLAVVRTLPRDLRGVYKLLRHSFLIQYYVFRQRDFISLFRSNVNRFRSKPCFILEDSQLTFQEVEDLTNQLANFFLAEGYAHGDVIALILDNSIEYPCVWIGLSKIGCIAALINSNLRATPLLHSIRTVDAKGVITSKQLLPEIENELKELNVNKVYLFDPKPTASSGKTTNGHTSTSDFETIQLYERLARCSAKPPKPIPFSLKQPVFYIFTSGTTGLPKAAVIKHSRFLLGSLGFLTATGINASDVMYDTLPLYHSLGGWICISYSLLGGCTTVLRKKFSASNFWKDCVRYKCTGFTYVGELCRFLLAQPPGEHDRQHSIRLCTGNGLRQNLWTSFVERFNVRSIYEFYAATESNAYFFNIDSRPGACGFYSLIAPRALGSVLVRFDPITMEPIRNERTKTCVRCKAGERGLLLGMISKNLLHAFDGYVNNPTGTQKKIVDDVYKRGDRAFNTGDVMMADKYGYLYFCDRTGDTFRWKGENVSTVEVENILMDILKQNDIMVFGVAIPETDGKAGMAVVLDNSSAPIDMDTLAHDLKKHGLPVYARPCFIRLTKHIEMTGTFKVKKVAFQEEGYDLERVTEPIFYLNQKKQSYEKLTPAACALIAQGKIHF